jgi:formylglycine-generating enzyme required for sulfatase activity
LILSLGEFSERQISPSERDALRPKIKGIYQTDADPGTHAAAEWLLQAWGDPEELDQPGRGEVPRRDPWVDDINEQWSRDVEMRKRKLAAVNATLAADKPKPCWYVNGQGQTMVVIPGPAEYAMGSPPGEANRSQDENQHLERIVLTFALDSKPVTIEEYRRFDTEFKGPDLSVLLPKASSPPPDLPVAFVSWYQAAAYCNWLSRQEGLSSDQWCYEQGTTGKVTSVRPNSLGLRGYRLPTEAEMEYSTRAGAFTSRFFGETPELLGKYAWYSDNSIFMLFLAPRPVGSKKPNDLGLFDVCGNVGCWCQDWYRASGGSPTDEAENPSAERTIRDFSFKSHYWTIRSAYRNSRKPTESSVHIGIRVAHSFLP